MARSQTKLYLHEGIVLLARRDLEWKGDKAKAPPGSNSLGTLLDKAGPSITRTVMHSGR